VFEAFRLDADAVKEREDALRERVRVLDEADRKAFWRLYGRRIRDPDTYAVLNWLFMAGLHHFYLGKVVAGMVNLALMAAGLVLLFGAPVVGGALIALVLVSEVPALFRSQTIAAEHNVGVGEALLRELHADGTPRGG
jgi:hypothetical protein